MFCFLFLSLVRVPVNNWYNRNFFDVGDIYRTILKSPCVVNKRILIFVVVDKIKNCFLLIAYLANDQMEYNVSAFNAFYLVMDAVSY